MGMAEPDKPTRTRIIEAASKLFYGEGIRAVSVDAVAEKAGVTKRTLYYHFESKDELVAAYLEARDQPNLKLMAGWFDKAEGPLPQKIEAIFQNLARSARHPRWKGCGFLRTAAELANLPGHPAIKIGARHKAGFERWLAGACAEHGAGEPEELARQVVLLMDGAFSVMLVHRDPAYVEAAGRAAAALASSAQNQTV
ncbi:DNA-binding transcriptional regulator, AcrR family [Bosea sp. 62]|nr:DNA-binding transcriptional regulator, AcrR family [Bosea sp. 46]CAD5269177.1 DNA-binding transcriptional regulator, AcrR family [Bosea sp. 7B]CAD5269450.1 DNA-binding transcriptional regulator, AcrR family [Bosea sp. 21B]VVT62522.1 DNA-binding transcriptional regulator, AcrR family [Bosea sp. EC-HK365B]VXB96269.1 DNA-binding transcriptional regulator, AcrR family [Bosea sp. 29B]VXC08040.1 DNA-binding transcriptional regulator, AcrR family [Bosea sp. 62]VXC41645.1 DNA-binding transcription